MSEPINITFKRWQPEDIHFLLRWKNDPELQVLDENTPYVRILEDDVEDWFLDHCVDNHEALLIVVDNTIIGCLGLKRISTGQADFYIIIGDKSYWRKGIGTYGMAHLEELAAARGDVRLMVGQVLCTNPHALAFYESLGYHIRPDSEDTPNDYVVVEKQISV